MRLAAIYLEKHDYLFEEPISMNFGGRYFYEFAKKGENIIVKRMINENFIPNFFNLTNLGVKVTNLTAIVGQNGAGKSTLLDVIRSVFVKNEYALPQSKSLILMETEDDGEPLTLRNDFAKIYLDANNGKDPIIELNRKFQKKPQTIYYSPHYDYKFNPNFDDVDDHDISFDKIIEKDLEELSEKDTDGSGFSYTASQELLFKNSMRQIFFLSSNLVKKQNVFKDLFQLQEHYEPMLYFRGYPLTEKEWNTPSQFREVLKLIAKKMEEERSNWHSIRKFKGTEVLNQTEINQYILKRNVIECVLSLLYRQMERRNTFLQEGYFPYDELQEELENSDAYHAFILFANHSAIKLRSKGTVNVFSEGVLQKLVDKIYEAIDKSKDEDSVTNEFLKTSGEDAVEILRLQREFINELNMYYRKFYSNQKELIYEERDKLEEFINYMPFSRRMSSGETSLLNLFSRIYDFLHSNLSDPKYLELKDHYILLLDEADLTFHLSWKKKYIKAILKTLPYFFNELENKPSIELVITTHDPITLSDLPNSNVIYIDRPDYDHNPDILDFNNKKRPLKTFGANISDILADSFFIENSLIGDFAFDKIQKTILWLNDKENIQDEDYHKKIIKVIDEPIIQRKLAEMYDDKVQGKFQEEIINEQIRELEELKSRLNQ